MILPITGTLSFLTLYNYSMVNRGDDTYGGPVSTEGSFHFGGGHIDDIYVSTEEITHVHAVLALLLKFVLCYCIVYTYMQGFLSNHITVCNFVSYYCMILYVDFCTIDCCINM